MTVNGQDICEKTLDEVNQILQDSWQRIKLEVEFDVADSVMASSGTYVVKLPRKPGGIGITLSGEYRYYPKYLDTLGGMNTPGPSCSKCRYLKELVKGHFINYFSGFNIQYSDIFC